uniref:Uncharacterized protein n=1 Tax=Knipowitschia caucasica TaxID=637954 RepID=A0AAV2JW37_KNICA
MEQEQEEIKPNHTYGSHDAEGPGQEQRGPQKATLGAQRRQLRATSPSAACTCGVLQKDVFVSVGGGRGSTQDQLESAPSAVGVNIHRSL